MKTLFSNSLLCAGFLAFASLAQAAPRGPLPDYFAGAKTVCIAKVKAVRDGKVNFEVTEILRGKPPAELELLPALGFDFKPGGEWFLMSCDYGGGGGKNSVGWLMSGFCDWMPASVVRVEKAVFVQDALKWDVPGSEPQDKTPDGSPAWTLEHVKLLLEKHPYKPRTD